MRTPPSVLTRRVGLALLAGVLLLGSAAEAVAERIKDIAAVRGMRANQLIGYGLIVGLDGTGDMTTQAPFTVQSLASMLGQLGVNLPAGTNLQLKNVAAVMVTASLPALAAPGQQLDVTVSSMANAKSLRGGTLLLTPLRGSDGQTYALAQGNVVIAGAGASAGGSKTQVNQLNAGRIPAGATVERAAPPPGMDGENVMLELHAADFGAARRVAQAINREIGEPVARALDAKVIQVLAPRGENERVGFLARLETIPVEGASLPARVVINARTGSVVMNQAVMLEPCAVAHGSLTVTVSSNTEVSQPLPLAGGVTVSVQKSDIQVKSDPGNLMMLEAGARLADVVKALNALGANPQDLLSILQAMKAAGALRAEIEVM